LPLQNNLSKGDIREYVKRRKMSGGTRSEGGRRGRASFANLKKTCHELGISFWNYLNDRIRGANGIPTVPQLIAARAQPPESGCCPAAGLAFTAALRPPAASLERCQRFLRSCPRW
jgi:hypothetical protein